MADGALLPGWLLWSLPAMFLLHDAEGNSKTVEALDKAIPILLEKGFQFATISELFELKGVEISGTDTNIYSELNAQ